MIDYGYCQSEACWGDAYMTGDRVDRVMQGINAVGGSRVRIGVQVGSWADLDRAVNSATANGLKPLLCILGNETLQAGSQSNVTAYAALCKAVALRYGPAGTGQVSEIEIENEMNLSLNPPFNASPAFYVQFLKAAYEAIKSVATSMTVISGGTIPSPTFAFFVTSINPVDWYTGVFAAGGGQYLDAVGFHWYFEQYPSLTDVHWTYLADVRALMVANGIAAKKIWVTEVGVGYPGGPGVTTASQARDFLKLLVDEIIARASTMGPFFIYQYANSYADPNNTPYGIVDYQFAPKSPIFEFAGSIRGAGTADVTRPSAPTGVMVSDVTENGAAVTWNPSTDDVAVTDYFVYLAAGTKLTSSLTTSASLAGLLTPGTSHQIYVTALDAAGNESLPSNLSSPFTTSAPSGLQAFDEGQFSGSTIPTSFTQLGLGFTVTAGVALPNPPATDSAVYTVAPFAVDKQTADHRMRITLAGASAASDRSAMAVVRVKPDGTEWVAALTTGGNNDSLRIVTCIAGKIRTRAAKNATPGTSGQFLELIASGDLYTANIIDTASVVRATVDWNDTRGVYPGAMNRRTGMGWHHKRVHSANFVAPGISGWKASDLNAVQAVTGAVEPWMYAIVDPDDWAELTATGSWETLLSSRKLVPAAAGPSVPPAGPPASSFVTRDAGTGFLMLDGDRFRFNGANCANDIGTVGTVNGNAYGGVDHSGSYLTTHTQADALVASAAGMNLTVLKATWSVHTTNHVDAVQPSLGVFNAAALDPIDYAISICKTRGIRFVLPFCENYTAKPWYCTANGVSPGSPDSSGNYPAPLFYTDATVIAAYKAHISFVLNHVNPYTGVALKDEDQIVCWETGNEFSGPASNAIYAAWVDDIAHHIKVVEGAQQLVQDGAYGVVPESLASTYIDIYDQHTYDQYRTPSFLEAEGASCHAAGKAYFIGEYDWTDDISSSHHPYITHTPYWYLDQMLDSWERSANIDGATFWDLMAPLTQWGDGYCLHYPPDSAFNGVSLSEATIRKDMLSDHALRRTGIAPKTFVSDTFTDTDGVELSTHVGEEGATWISQSAYGGALSNIQSNRIYGGAAQGRYYSSGVPATADYTVSADIYVASNLGFAGVLARALSLANYSYAAYVWNVGGTVGIFLDYSPPGNIGYHAITTPTVGSTHNIALEVDGGTVSVYWDSALVIGPIAHTARPSAGRAGVIQGGGGSTTTGYHLDNVTATDA